MSPKICPRCGQPYSYLEKKRVKGSKQEYYYAVHVYKEGGKWRKRRCYLGPSVYTHVAPIQGFQLYGLMRADTERLLMYLEEIVRELRDREDSLDDEGRRRIAWLMRDLIALAGGAGRRTITGGSGGNEPAYILSHRDQPDECRGENKGEV